MKINDYQIVRAERIQAILDEQFRPQNEKIEDLETQLLDTQEGIVELYNIISEGINND